jgi:hypothetical protein
MRSGGVGAGRRRAIIRCRRMISTRKRIRGRLQTMRRVRDENESAMILEEWR